MRAYTRTLFFISTITSNLLCNRPVLLHFLMYVLDHFLTSSLVQIELYSRHSEWVISGFRPGVASYMLATWHSEHEELTSVGPA